MDVWFLEAAVPVTKRIEQLPDGSIKKHPYPLVSEFTSHKLQINDLPSFQAALELCGAKGWTLIKGALQRELKSESRMGTTVADQSSEWLCFDLDGLELPPHSLPRDTDAFMHLIGLGDVSYVIQWSASAGLPGSKGLRCHIFTLLQSPLPAQVLKDYLKSLNLDLPPLAAQLSLTASHVALKWPLDITACQNDKLIYIAPPSLVGLTDPYSGNRVEYVQKSCELLTANRIPIPDAGKLKQKIVAKIADLRKQAGLPDVNLKLKKARKGRVDYAPGPAEARVTGEKRERGFVYLNLNGGDSWGYYYPENNPEFIFNFKGEPVYKTEELLPAYWATLNDNTTITPDTTGKIYLAFSDLSRDSRDFGLEYDTATDELDFHTFTSEGKAKAWSKAHGRVITDALPFFKTVYDPTNKDVIDLEKGLINIYRASKPSKSKPRTVPGPSPVTARIINHVFSGEQELIEHFHNWMACIVQYGTITRTSWVWHGVQGTGKGLLIGLIREVLGPSNCAQILMSKLESQFTGLFRNKQLINIDEIQTSASVYEQGTIMPKIKEFITQSTIQLREMYSEEKEAPNYCNFVLSSNYHDPIRIPRDDRRTNVCQYQAIPLVPHILTREEARDYDLNQPEAEHMYWYWKTRPASLSIAAAPFDNEARRTLTDVSSSAIELAAEALRLGNLKYFWDAMPTTPVHTSALSLSPRDVLVQRYKDVIINIVLTGETKLLRDELVIIMQYLVTDKVPVSPTKFTQYLRHQRLEITDVWRDGRKQRGLVANWISDPTWLSSAQQDAQKMKR
jgi:hypothetical protein